MKMYFYIQVEPSWQTKSNLKGLVDKLQSLKKTMKVYN